ncbi:MAG: 2,3-bisphosphoglycerate-independent phosphoglycerate mutase [Patescibacteria group bacterium]
MGPIVLTIMDGWGIAKPNKGNAILLAKTPNLDKLQSKYSSTTLIASGSKVGLPVGQDGNSEAGHMNIGAGRIVEQDAVAINHNIYDGTFYKNPAFMSAINHVKNHNSKIHLMGLLTDGMSAHAFPDHLYALLDLLSQKKIKKIYLHLFTDGRDSPQHEAIKYLRALIKSFKNGEKIATITGRFYAMERNKRWGITKQAYELLTLGKAKYQAQDAIGAVLQGYNRKNTDEFIEPTLIDKNGLIEENDSIIYFNLRSDRTRQLTKAFVQKDFNKKNPGSFIRKKTFNNLLFIAMTDFGPDLDHILSAFPSQDITQTLPKVLENKKQLYISESEKYAHVTYFFNGGYADIVGGEDRSKIPSPDICCYDKAPKMSAPNITKEVINYLKKNKYDFYCINYANPDMVGHTGNLKAGIKACECVDTEIGKLYKEVSKKKGILIITSDHGNAEEMINLKTGEVDTKHSINSVPFIITIKNQKLRTNGFLGNIAPTVLDLFDIKKPKEMDCKSLLC